MRSFLSLIRRIVNALFPAQISVEQAEAMVTMAVQDDIHP